MIAEFNPLWNVDGTETTTRILERDGTITNAKSGNDAIEKRGSDTDALTGGDTVANSGSDTTTYSGSETNTRNGNISKTDTGGYIDTRTETTTDGDGWQNVEKNERTYPSGGNVETEHYTNLADVKNYTNRSDTLQHGKTETTTHNTTDTKTFNSTDTTKYNSSNTETLDTIDTERISLTRQGNIGVTTTTKLLTEYWDFALYTNFIDTVVKDCLESFTLIVY